MFYIVPVLKLQHTVRIGWELRSHLIFPLNPSQSTQQFKWSAGFNVKTDTCFQFLRDSSSSSAVSLLCSSKIAPVSPIPLLIIPVKWFALLLFYFCLFLQWDLCLLSSIIIISSIQLLIGSMTHSCFFNWILIVIMNHSCVGFMMVSMYHSHFIGFLIIFKDFTKRPQDKNRHCELISFLIF